MSDTFRNEFVHSHQILELISAYTEEAKERRGDAEFETAAEYYTAAGHGELMLCKQLPDHADTGDVTLPSASPLARLGYGMKRLLAACLCYRLAGRPARCQNLSERARLTLTDNSEWLFTERPKLGLCHEIRGDFMIVAGNEDFHAAYDTAALQYEDVESDFGWQMEDGFGDFTQIVEELAADVGYDLPDDVTELVYENSLDERIEYKRTHFPDIIDRVIASGNWNSDVL